MKFRFADHPVALLLAPFLAFFLYCVADYVNTAVNFPALDALAHVSGKQAGTFAYSSARGGCALRFSLAGAGGSHAAVITSRRRCQELQQLDGMYLGAIEAWLVPGQAAGRPARAYQVMAGGRLLRSHQVSAADARQDARRDLITVSAALLLTLLVFAPLLLAMMTALAKDKADASATARE